MSALAAESLLNLGFADIAAWTETQDNGLNYSIDIEDRAAAVAVLEVRNALYAFVEGETVRYIGKTARSIRRRFIGYCNPGESQQTNKRCHNKIKAILANGGAVRIYVFTPVSQLRYGDFEIDLAAGLEEALINAFSPPWNGRDGARTVSEDAEREVTAENTDTLAGKSKTDADAAALSGILAHPGGVDNQTTFSVKLGQTYYQQGFINPGVEASKHLGKHGERIILYLGSVSDPVDSLINRTANSNGSVRLVGNNQRIAEWFKRNFQLGDLVEAVVLDPNHIFLRGPHWTKQTRRSPHYA